MPKKPTVAVAGLWSAITMAALTVVAAEQSPPGGEAVAAQTTAAIDPTATGSIVLTDATGNRYRMRKD